MIGVSKLYCGTVEASDPLRYARDSSELPSHLLQFSKDKKPVVVWNVGQRCNLHCVHCYSHSQNRDYQNELSHAEGLVLLDDLAEFRLVSRDCMGLDVAPVLEYHQRSDAGLDEPVQQIVGQVKAPRRVGRLLLEAADPIIPRVALHRLDGRGLQAKRVS